MRKQLIRKKKKQNKQKNRIKLEGRKEGKTGKQIAEEYPEYFKTPETIDAFVATTLKKDKKAYEEYVKVMENSKNLSRKNKKGKNMNVNEKKRIIFRNRYTNKRKSKRA